MKKLIKTFLKICGICHGMGVIEDTNHPNKCAACNGKGNIK